MSKTKTFHFGIYPGWLRVYSDLGAWCRSTGNEVIADDIGGIYWADGHQHHIWCDGTVAAAAHEAVHMAVMVMDLIGHTTKPGTDEPMAYLVDWALDRILSVCKKGSKES